MWGTGGAGAGGANGTTQRDVGHRHRGIALHFQIFSLFTNSFVKAAFVIQSPQNNDDDDDDDALSGVFSSEVPFSLEDFLLATAPKSLYSTEVVACREAEHRHVVQQWILGL